jgi:hypothetical protein
LHTVDDKRFLCAHQDAADLTLIADDGALSQTGHATSSGAVVYIILFIVIKFA